MASIEKTESNKGKKTDLESRVQLARLAKQAKNAKGQAEMVIRPNMERLPQAKEFSGADADTIHVLVSSAHGVQGYLFSKPMGINTLDYKKSWVFASDRGRKDMKTELSNPADGQISIMASQVSQKMLVDLHMFKIGADQTLLYEDDKPRNSELKRATDELKDIWRQDYPVIQQTKGSTNKDVAVPVQQKFKVLFMDTTKKWLVEALFQSVKDVLRETIKAKLPPSKFQTCSGSPTMITQTSVPWAEDKSVQEITKMLPQLMAGSIPSSSGAYKASKILQSDYDNLLFAKTTEFFNNPDDWKTTIGINDEEIRAVISEASCMAVIAVHELMDEYEKVSQTNLKTKLSLFKAKIVTIENEESYMNATLPSSAAIDT